MSPEVSEASQSAYRTETPARIMDAAFGCVAEMGLSRTTMEDVGRAAGVSRQTVYRYFPSKDQLVMALVQREEERFLDGVRAAFATDDNLEDALFDGILFCLRFAREHPLLDRLLATDSQMLLPYLTTKATPTLVRAREAMVSLIRSKEWVSAALVVSAADLLVRLAVSYAVTPPDRPVDDVARDLARIVTAALTRKESTRR